MFKRGCVPKLPKVVPEKTICWFDLEGVLMEKNISFYLLRFKPFLAVRALLNGFVKASCDKLKGMEKDFKEKWVEECKKYYMKRMSKEEKYAFGKFIYQLQSEKHKENLNDVLKVCKIDDSYEICVITSADSSITKGFLESLPQELHIAEENVFASHGDRYIDKKEKARIVRNIKARGKKIMGFGDTSSDAQALEEADVPCRVSTYCSLLMPSNGKGYEFEDLREVKKFLDAIHYDSLVNEKYEQI
jgi:phosphoserine phosphatase